MFELFVLLETSRLRSLVRLIEPGTHELSYTHDVMMRLAT
jgi:hypothetical protein